MDKLFAAYQNKMEVLETLNDLNEKTIDALRRQIDSQEKIIELLKKKVAMLESQASHAGVVE